MPTYWIVVGMPENFEIARKRGFDMFGFKSTRRRETSEMKPGDKLVFYLTGVKQFGGIAKVTSDVYEQHNKVFMSEKKPNEDFPFRVKTKAEVLLDEPQRLYVPDYVPQLEFTRKGATKSWALFFQGNLHKISEADYKLLERDMKAAKRRKGSASTTKNGAKAASKASGGKAGARSKSPATSPAASRSKKAATRKSAGAKSR
jgi:predicted RNA-binding protein